jgi:hypothetical protein
VEIAVDREIAQHFSYELREARAVALKDAEAFEQLLFVFERLGVYLTGSIKNLGGYADALGRVASNSPMAQLIPKDLPDWHAPFSTLYEIVKTARNEALHEGSYARHLTKNAVELSMILEDALMVEAFCARNFMVRDPVCAYMWQPISAIRRAMLVNSFSFLPGKEMQRVRPLFLNKEMQRVRPLFLNNPWARAELYRCFE